MGRSSSKTETREVLLGKITRAQLRESMYGERYGDWSTHDSTKANSGNYRRDSKLGCDGTGTIYSCDRMTWTCELATHGIK